MRGYRFLHWTLPVRATAAFLGAVALVAPAAIALGDGPPAAAAGASGFTVQGDQILDPSGHSFVPVGTNLLGPDSFWTSQTAGLSGAARAWGFNTVRLTTCLPGGCAGTGYDQTVNNNLDQIVSEYSAAHIVVMIALHQITPGLFPNAADLTSITAWWAGIAARYKANPYVWFNTLNEPGNSVGVAPGPVIAQWAAVEGQLITAIRSTGAQNPIVVDGTQWGQDAGAWNTSPIPTGNSAILTSGAALAAAHPNLIFSIHVYDQWGGSTTATNAERDARLGDFIDRVHALELPLVIGETGAPSTETTTLRALGTQSAFRVAPPRGVGILTWHGQAGDGFTLTTPGPFNAIDSTTSPTNLTWLGRLDWAYGHWMAAIQPAATTTGTPPPAVVPEAPFAALLPITSACAAMAVLGTRRRRANRRVKLG